MTTSRSIVLKRGTFPAITAIYYHNGTGWQEVVVGPPYGDLQLSAATQIISQATYTGNAPPVGTEQDLVVPGNFRTIQFAMSSAARTAGPYVNALCESPSFTFTIRYGTGSGSSGKTKIITPPVYISYVGVEGSMGVQVDNGHPDNDGDGIPDEEDPDDDNDGRPDNDDDFPFDSGEKDDTDGDGQGDNADPDDDNDGTPDGDDAYPFDPDRQDEDSDGDGTPDEDDAFPNNPGEDADSDGDGVGDNQDPNDNSPPGGGDQGDGDGNPGNGDGDGGPGPGLPPDDDGDDDGPVGSVGEIDDGSGMINQIKESLEGIKDAVKAEVGSWKVWEVQLLNPGVSSWTLTMNFGPKLGSYTHAFDADFLAIVRKAVLVALGFAFVAGSVRTLSWR